MRRMGTRCGGGGGGKLLLFLALATMTMAFAGTASAFGEVNTITGTETWPNVTQSGSVVAHKPGTSQVLVAYTDGRGAMESPANYLGLSVSNDNGVTFKRLGQPTQFTGHGTGYGSPLLGYSQKLGKWIIGQLSSGCGGKGIGLWTSPNGEVWTAGACAHSGTNDDRATMWIDNSSGSAFYGRIYISFTNLAAGSSGQVQVIHSDDGVTWSAPVTLSPGGLTNAPRNVNIAGSGAIVSNGVLIETGGGEVGTGQTVFIMTSSDGGSTWALSNTQYSTTVAGTATCEGKAAVAPIWRRAGWGQIAVTPKGVPAYIYAGRSGATSDEGDIFFNGTKLNTDSTTKAQWNPSLRVAPNGTMLATWYDRRNSTNGTNYQRYQRISYDAGVTWEKEEPVTALIPQPTQPNPNLPACLPGDVNLGSAGTSLLYDTWTDGRVALGGVQVAKVFFHAFSTKSPSVSKAPVAITEPATLGAILNGKVNPRGLPTTYRFEYGTTTAYGSFIPAAPTSVGSGTSDVSVAQAPGGLATGTTYHFRIVATNSEGTTYGADRTFVKS